MSKLFKFVKENKFILLTLLVVALAFGLLAISGQFVKFSFIRNNEYDYQLSGYEFIFGKEDRDLPNIVSGQGIAIFVMLILGFVGAIFSKKSSFVQALTGLVLLVVSILFFTTEGAVGESYPSYYTSGDFQVGFVPYLLGGLICAVSLLLIYNTVIRMKDEVKHPAQPKGPSYNYLHK